MTGKSSFLPDSMQIDRLQKAADDARQQLESKENVVKTLSRDGSKLDKERCADLSGSQDIKQYMLMFCLGRIPWSVCQQTVSWLAANKSAKPAAIIPLLDSLRSGSSLTKPHILLIANLRCRVTKHALHPLPTSPTSNDSCCNASFLCSTLARLL